MLQELDTIVLATDLPELELTRGDIGTIVLVHPQQAGYEVEFTSLTGETVAVVSLSPTQLRPVRPHELPHVRTVSRMAA
jgi:hypothetical protein